MSERPGIRCQRILVGVGGIVPVVLLLVNKTHGKVQGGVAGIGRDPLSARWIGLHDTSSAESADWRGQATPDTRRRSAGGHDAARLWSKAGSTPACSNKLEVAASSGNAMPR